MKNKNMQNLGELLYNALYGLEWTHKYCVENLTKYGNFEEVCKFMNTITEKHTIFDNQHIEKCDIEGCVSYFKKNKNKIKSLCKMNSKKIAKENIVAPTVEKEEEIDYTLYDFSILDKRCPLCGNHLWSYDDASLDSTLGTYCCSENCDYMYDQFMTWEEICEDM